MERMRRLLAAVSPAAELDSFSHELLGPLVGLAARQRRELYRTLETYVACGGHSVQTARRLRAHRNTVLYRLERLQTLLGVDLRDPQARFVLQLALQAREISRRAAAQTEEHLAAAR